MALEPLAGPRRGISILSLTDPQTISLIFQAIGHTSRARRKLRRDIFAGMVQSVNLQHQLLEILVSYPETQREIVLELAKNFQFRRRLTVLAGQQTDGRRMLSARPSRT
jgi:hypothetical protein